MINYGLPLLAGPTLFNYRLIVHPSGIPSTPDIDLTRISHEHLVHWYSDKSHLFGSVADFLAGSFKEEKAGISIATAEHRAGIEQELSKRGFDPLQLQQRGLYIPLDAAETLKRFMVDGRPDPKKFVEVVGSLISRATTSWGGVRAFGEMVAVLWKEGNRDGALELERFWNDLGQIYSFALFCAYPKEKCDVSDDAMKHICEAHSLVIL